MNNMIRGKVAKVLNKREVALNVGKKHRVDVGMQFDVLASAADEIIDPDTGEVIGALNRPKVRVEVTVVGQRFAVASTFRTIEVNVGGSISIPALMAPEQWITQDETILTDEETWDDLGPNHRYVKTGDIVVQVPLRLRSDEGDESYPSGRENEEIAVS